MVVFVLNPKGILYVLLFYFGFFAVAYNVFAIWKSFELGILTWINMLAFSTLVILACISHVVCTFSDPGLIPTDYAELNVENIPIADQPLIKIPSVALPADSESPIQSPYYNLSVVEKVQISSKNRAIYELLERRCELCHCVKPPRAHHCSTCDRCIARLDHHCPWTNNCVAYYTHRPFLQFLLHHSIRVYCSVSACSTI